MIFFLNFWDLTKEKKEFKEKFQMVLPLDFGYMIQTATVSIKKFNHNQKSVFFCPP